MSKNRNAAESRRRSLSSGPLDAEAHQQFGNCVHARAGEQDDSRHREELGFRKVEQIVEPIERVDRHELADAPRTVGPERDSQNADHADRSERREDPRKNPKPAEQLHDRHEPLAECDVRNAAFGEGRNERRMSLLIGDLEYGGDDEERPEDKAVDEQRPVDALEAVLEDAEVAEQGCEVAAQAVVHRLQHDISPIGSGNCRELCIISTPASKGI